MKAQSEVVVILGKRGSGKTTLARKLSEKHNRVIFYDSTGHDYQDGVICYEIKELFDYLERVENFEKFRVTFKPLHAERVFPMFCKICRHLKNLCVVIDEVDLYASATGDIDENFLWLVKIGRHSDISMVCVSRRPAEMSRNITAQARQFYIFNSTEPRDIAFLKAVIGNEAEKIILLDNFSFLHYNNGIVVIEGSLTMRNEGGKETPEAKEGN
jgi:AAA+ ATPase superfamily predicted ATPase